MVLVLWHTGMRPGEARQLCPSALDTSEEVWQYEPPLHKTQHHGKVRTIAIGPRAQEVLRPYLLRVPRPDPARPVFSPGDAMAERHQKTARGRMTPRRSGEVRGHARKESSGSRLGEAYSKDSLARAIARACALAGVNRWSPNQLRHAAATRIRKELGIDAARAVLGHSSAKTTEVYAEIDAEKARDVMSRFG